MPSEHPPAALPPAPPSQSPTRGVSAVLLAALWLVLALLAWRLSDVLLLMFGGVIVAVALHALAAPLQRHLRVSRRLSVAAAVVLMLAALTLGGWLIGDRLVDAYGQRAIARAGGLIAAAGMGVAETFERRVRGSNSFAHGS